MIWTPPIPTKPPALIKEIAQTNRIDEAIKRVERDVASDGFGVSMRLSDQAIMRLAIYKYQELLDAEAV